MASAVIGSPAISALPESAAGILGAVERSLGAFGNLFATAAHSPSALESLWGQFLHSERSALPARVRVAVALRVAQLHGCAYSLAATATLAARLGIAGAEARALRTGRGAGAREGTVLALAARLVEHAGHHAGFELAAARRAGLSDRELIEVVQLVAQQTFVDALASLADVALDAPPVPLDLDVDLETEAP